MSKKGLTISARRDFIDIVFRIVPLERCAWALARGLLAAHPQTAAVAGDQVAMCGLQTILVAQRKQRFALAQTHTARSCTHITNAPRRMSWEKAHEQRDVASVSDSQKITLLCARSVTQGQLPLHTHNNCSISARRQFIKILFLSTLFYESQSCACPAATSAAWRLAH